MIITDTVRFSSTVTLLRSSRWKQLQCGMLNSTPHLLTDFSMCAEHTHTKEIQRRRRDICIFQDGILQDCISVAGAALEGKNVMFTCDGSFFNDKETESRRGSFSQTL